MGGKSRTRMGECMMETGGGVVGGGEDWGCAAGGVGDEGGEDRGRAGGGVK